MSKTVYTNGFNPFICSKTFDDGIGAQKFLLPTRNGAALARLSASIIGAKGRTIFDGSSFPSANNQVAVGSKRPCTVTLSL
eukprot:2552725-Amphidinium_carterae.1